MACTRSAGCAWRRAWPTWGALRAALVLLVMLATQPPLAALAWAAAAEGTGTGAGASAADASFAAELLSRINQLRDAQGLQPWQPDAHLQQIAAAHARALARQGRLSHGGFDDRLARSGASLCVENLAAGRAGPQQLLAAWLESAGHRGNLVEPRAQQVGLARDQGVVVLLACRADRPARSAAAIN